MRGRASWCVFTVVVVAVLIRTVSSAKPAAAQSFSFPVGGFTTSNVCVNSNSPPPSCQILTNGSPSRVQVASGGVLRLTTANQNQHGSAWFKIQQPLSPGFTTAFQFKVSNSNACRGCSFPADGLALVIQNDPSGTGAIGYTGNGQNLSYGNNDVSTAHGPGAAILNSLAVELDTFQNSNYSDPNGNHIAVQSCGPNNSSTLTPNSADHDYICPNGSVASLALQGLPSGLSLSDGLAHTITVNYLPPGSCTSGCNNLSVYFDSTLILQTTVDLTQQLNLTSGSNAYIGFTAATGSSVENNDIVSWSFSQWPLSPITINEPVQPTTPTNFNYTSSLSAISDYSQSGLPPSAFQGLFMQGTAQTITDQQFSDLVNNTPFQGSTCQHQDTGTGTYACVTTTDLCTTSSNSNPQGSNCLTTGTNPLINVSNSYNLDPAQKPIIAPGYIMGKDNALGCGAGADNSCKGLVSVFTGINGDLVTSNGHTNNFNSVLIPIIGGVQPSTSITTNPPLNGGWVNGPVSLNFNGIETVPTNNPNPPSPLPTISAINWQATGANAPNPSSGNITGSTGSILIPGAVEGTTLVTYAATDSSNVVETQVTNSGNNVSTATPTLTIKTDLTPPTVSCTPPTASWQATDVIVPCTASDNANGSGLAGPSSFNVQTNVPPNTETNNATIPAVTVQDIAGNTSAPAGPFGPFEVDKLAPTITAPTISPASPVYGQSVSASYSCADGGSGVVLCGPTGSAQIPPTSNTGTLTSPVDSSVGPHTFTVNSQDLVGNVSQPSSVTYTVGKATPVITWANPAPITYGTALSATQLNATANVAGTFIYSPAAGTVLTAGTQALSVAFTPTDTTDYNSANATVTLVVNQAAPVITWATPAPITYGTPLGVTQLNATANVAGTFVYSPAAGTVLPAGTQTLSATFTPADSTDYTVAIASVLLVVNQASPTVSWTVPSPIAYGTPLSSVQLNASANVPGTFVYSPPAGTILGAGTQTLSVTFTPTDATDYSIGTATVPLIVNKATPLLNWPPPAPMTYGTPLSSIQLNATSNVPGTFLYSPGAGTILTAGTQTLSVTFTPSDNVDYITVNQSNSIVVNRAVPMLKWPTPAPIPYGTPLTSTQLDATANVPGTFVYVPPAGTILSPGNQTLSVTFTPSDSVDYTPATASVVLLVTQPLITFNPNAINFGKVIYKSTPSIKVAVSNPGSSPLTIKSIAMAGHNEDNDLFKITNNCKSSVAPGGSCSFTVTLSAVEIENFSLTLLVTDNVSGSSQSLPVTANIVKH